MQIQLSVDVFSLLEASQIRLVGVIFESQTKLNLARSKLLLWNGVFSVFTWNSFWLLLQHHSQYRKPKSYFQVSDRHWFFFFFLLGVNHPDCKDIAKRFNSGLLLYTKWRFFSFDFFLFTFTTIAFLCLECFPKRLVICSFDFVYF